MSTDKKELAKLFFLLINELEQSGINLSIAAASIGVKVSTAHTWQRRGSGPKRDHILSLVESFPSQLRDRASQLGIPLPEVESDSELRKELQSAMLLIKRLDKDIELSNATKEELQELRKENARLKDQVDILMKELKGRSRKDA